MKMAGNVNRVLIIGQVWERPVISTTKNGVAMASFEITTKHRHVDENGEVTALLQRHPVRVYGDLAHRAGRCLFPDETLLVEGRLQTHLLPRGVNSETVIVAGTLLKTLGLLADFGDDGHQSAQQPPPLTPSFADI